MNNKDRAERAINWIDSLSVTTERQGTKELGDPVRGFCCLGYGCYINKLDYQAAGMYSVPFQDLVGLIGRYGLPKSLAVGLGYDKYTGGLADDNDHGASFSEIATKLRTHPYRYLKAGVAKLVKDHYRTGETA